MEAGGWICFFFEISSMEQWVFVVTWSKLISFLSNFLQCLGHIWYLSVDYQLYIISPIVVYLLVKLKLKGLILTGLTVIAGQSWLFWASFKWVNLEFKSIFRSENLVNFIGELLMQLKYISIHHIASGLGSLE